MPGLSLFWDRVALTFYTLGLFFTLAVLLWRREHFFHWVRRVIGLGFLFQLVSVVETGYVAHHFPVTQFSETVNLLALLIAGIFLLAWRLYSPRGLPLIIEPLLFLLTFSAIYGPAGTARIGLQPAPTGLHNAWIYWHVALSLLGLAGLALAVAGALLYLWTERQLKHRPLRASLARALPPLETLDRMIYLALLFGFPLLTLGLIIGFYRAGIQWGVEGLQDPKILISVITWGLYLILLFVRWSSGWRGRRSALIIVICFLTAVAGFISNSFSHLHDFMR